MTWRAVFSDLIEIARLRIVVRTMRLRLRIAEARYRWRTQLALLNLSMYVVLKEKWEGSR